MRYSLSMAALFALVGSSVFAQAPAYDPKQVPTYDAGALARQAEQMFKQSQLKNNQPKRASLPAEMVFDESAQVTVIRFKFNGNKLFTSEQLQDATASFLNHPLSSKELKKLTDSVSEAYRKTGWIVQAYIPRQDFSSGEMTLQVIETIPPSRPSN